MKGPAVKPTVLMILDGWGLNDNPKESAITAANTPVIDQLWADNPHTAIGCMGGDVGLTDGQMGNSEVGHLNIGAGRIVYQDLTKITKAIKDGDFFENKVLLDAVEPSTSPRKGYETKKRIERFKQVFTNNVIQQVTKNPVIS